MQQEMMKHLQATEKVNPMGGCFPIVVQIPVFIALYWVLLVVGGDAPRAVDRLDHATWPHPTRGTSCRSVMTLTSHVPDLR
jgi:hypothetical protein